MQYLHSNCVSQVAVYMQLSVLLIRMDIIVMDFDFWPPKYNQFILVSVFRSFTQGIPELSFSGMGGEMRDDPNPSAYSYTGCGDMKIYI